MCFGEFTSIGQDDCLKGYNFLIGENYPMLRVGVPMKCHCREGGNLNDRISVFYGNREETGEIPIRLCLNDGSLRKILFFWQLFF